ncbi:hypothetical protein FGRMN_9088 [Fusarium graminum]|nr:hypothetical protein FGRMN_9088 [Fusarium graminum]
MLQTRPASSTSMIPNAQGQNGHQYATAAQTPRYAVPSPTGYRGTTAPVQQYAFTSTPTLHHSQTWQPQAQPSRTYNHNANYGGRQFSSSGANMQYNAMGVGQTGARDDSAIPQRRNIVPAPRPHSAFLAGSTQPTSPTSQSKAAPDRYRRPSLSAQQNQHGRSQSNAVQVNAGIPTANQLYNGPNPSRSAIPNRPNSFYNAVPGVSMDDMQLLQSPMDDSNRSRRRSIRADSDLSKPAAQDKSKTEGASQNLRPVGKRAVHSRNGRIATQSANRNVSTPTGNPSSQANNETTSKQDHTKVNIPPRGSSSDAIKRSTNPSPLSRPATMASEVAEDGSSNAQGAGNMESPAAKQLAAINKGRKVKSKTSRLRRAFSFGSAADFRKADDEAETTDKTEPSRLHKDPTTDEAYDAEQARIAEAQEAAGLGHSIYGGRFFGGSTDNLSISSTASSASIMIRKMGRGMKKGGRSFVGIFRPKSVIGVAPADGPVKPEASHAAVSMVTVEAETQRVNVSADPRQTDTFPHLERNSIDTSLGIDIAERLGSSGTDNSNSRKSIVGGDRERAEVLAAVRKGILKRPGSASPSIRPADSSPGLDLPSVPAVNDSPNSSAPSTPNDESQGHRRTGSIALGGEDYFMSALRLRQDSKSAPNTPAGSTKRNATFSPRIVFHDTWPPQEYDRRGEVATCNRLTPMLAQQIKEELNTFKMNVQEMEVHENSKIYTHFF